MGKTPSAIVGLDLGNSTIKAVLLQKHGVKYVLSRVAVLQTHRDPLNSVAPTEQELAAQIREVASLVKAGRADVHFTVNSSGSTIRYVELPGIPLNELRAALKLNSATYLRQNFDNYTFDACPLDAEAASILSARNAKTLKKGASAVHGKIKMLVGGIASTEVILYYHAARRAGIRPKSLQLAPISLANAFEAAHPDIFFKEAIAILDLGLLTTSLTILDQGKPLLTRAVAIGGKHITEHLAQISGGDFMKAENAKVQGDPLLAQAVSHTCANLIREVRSSINFFEKNTESLVSKIYLAGASARSQTILDALSQETGKACEPWSAAEGLEADLPAEQRELFVQHQATLCAALGAARSGTMDPSSPRQPVAAPAAPVPAPATS